MTAVNVPPVALVAILAGGGLLLWAWSKKKPGETVAASLGAAAVGVAADTAGGVVLGIGDVLGVPRTEQTQCEKDIAAGRTWDASFSCPAGTFISEGLLGGWDFSSEPAGQQGVTGSW